MEKRRLLATLGVGALLAGIIVTFPAVGATQDIDLDDAAAKLSIKLETQEDEHEGPDKAITGSALDQAKAAALAYVGEGRVTDTEVGDEDGYYEVEVTLDDGTQVDVHVDENFQVIGVEAEDNGEDEDDDSEDDD
jgi:uncharacterized membrane protein YkoI